jgi:hypothetical protein
MEELRYGNTLGHQKDCERFLEAVETLHSVILHRQGKNYDKYSEQIATNREFISQYPYFSRCASKRLY